MKKLKTLHFIIAVFIIIMSIEGYAQDVEAGYEAELKAGNYQKALDQIIGRLNEIYSSRVTERRIPSDYLSFNSPGSEIDLIALFRGRQESGFFVEDNPELAELHVNAGMCYRLFGKRKDALNHYIQSLRFRRLENRRDDVIFYQISQVFKGMDSNIYFKGYIDALEQAYSLNSTKFEYSYELGMALVPTPEKKKAVYHLERFLSLSGQSDPEVLLTIAGLYESMGRYLESEKYYNEYLRLKPEDFNIMFATGYNAFYRTGNFTLAEFMFQGVLQKAPAGDHFKRAKSNEYLGDMAMSDVKYDRAIDYYKNVIVIHTELEKKISVSESEKKEIDSRLNEIKGVLLNEKDLMKYDEYKNLLDDYESLLSEQGEKQSELDTIRFSLKQLGPGKVRWNMAQCYERKGDRSDGVTPKKENYSEAVKYYRESMKYEYNAGKARENIKKLQLKIKRGY